MNKIVRLAVAMAVATVCASASADVVTFEGLTPSIYTNGDTIVQGNALLTTLGQGGYDGVIVNGSDPDRCDVAVCPAGSTYYAGLNDGGVSLGFFGSTFTMTGVDFAFVLPAPALLDASAGQLIVKGSDGSSVSQDFGLQGSDGQYAFMHWNFDGEFARTRFTQVSFSACLYNEDRSSCNNPAGNQAQFAIDNIDAFVPEPGSLPLVALSLMGMMAIYRRRKSV